MKTCPQCKQELPLDQFYNHIGKSGGKTSWCKQCIIKATNERRKDPVQKELWKEYQRKSTLQRRYGITAEEYASMHEAQGGVCLICGLAAGGGRGAESRLAVDHDHETGKVRGLLCNNCNNGLGRFKDSPELLRKAIDYLTKD